MFISRGELFHESSWALWFQHAAGLLPVSALQADPGEPSEVVALYACPKAMFRQAVRDHSSMTRCLDGMEGHTSMQLRWLYPVDATKPVLTIKTKSPGYEYDCPDMGLVIEHSNKISYIPGTSRITLHIAIWAKGCSATVHNSGIT